ncbi:MAG: PIN domain-containing protein [Thermoleophilia bacterium]
MMKKKYFLDANIFLRFLTGDDRRKAEACRRLVQKAIDGELHLETHPLILAEVVWVLESYYRLQRGEIAAKLEMILNTPNLAVADAGAFARAVELYSESKIDFADCFAAAMAEQEGGTLLSYDRDFDKLDGVRRLEPGDIR